MLKNDGDITISKFFILWLFLTKMCGREGVGGKNFVVVKGLRQFEHVRSNSTTIQM